MVSSLRGRSAALALVLAAALALAALVLRGESPRAAPSPAPTRVASRPPPGTSPGKAPAAIAEALPPSLRGTQVDGALAVDADGNFVPTPDAIVLFDYFLSASGEEPAELTRDRILAEIERRLEPDAAREAAALLDTYLGFREALRDLAEARWAPDGLERRLQWIRELRREHFGTETADALFGLDERVLALDLERRRLLMDRDLDEAKRYAALAGIESQLPEPVREARRSAKAPHQLRRQVAALRLAGASEGEIFAARERRFGAEAAARLEALDRERASWQQRLAAYRAERDVLLAEVAGEARAAELEALRSRHFEAGERRRARALDGTR